MAAGNLRGADHDVGLREAVGDGIGRREPGFHPRTELHFGVGEFVGLAVDQGDACTQSDRNPRRAHAHHAGADDDHVRGRHAGQAGDELAVAAVRLVQAQRAHLRGKPTGNIGHRLQQRQAAACTGHGFVGNRRHAVGHQFARQFGCGSQMQIAEQQLALAQHRRFGRLRFLHLDHQVGGVGFGRGGNDGRPGGAIGIVAKADRCAGAGFDADAVARLDQFTRAFGGECHPVFVVLDFPGNADVHGEPLEG